MLCSPLLTRTMVAASFCACLGRQLLERRKAGSWVAPAPWEWVGGPCRPRLLLAAAPGSTCHAAPLQSSASTPCQMPHPHLRRSTAECTLPHISHTRTLFEPHNNLQHPPMKKCLYRCHQTKALISPMSQQLTAVFFSSSQLPKQMVIPNL